MTINAAGCDGQRNSHVYTHSTICSRLALQLLRQEVHRVMLTGTLTHFRCHEFGRFGRFRSLVPATRDRPARDVHPVPIRSVHAGTEMSRPTLSALSDAAGITEPRFESYSVRFGSGGRFLPCPSRSSSPRCSSPRTGIPPHDTECVYQAELCEPNAQVRTNPVFATFSPPHVNEVALNTGLPSKLSRATIRSSQNSPQL